MSNKADTADEGAGLSFQEKSLWLSLFANLAVYAYYFWRALALGRDNPDAVGALFATTTILLIVILIVGNAALALHARPSRAEQQKDERDRRIALYGARNAYYVLASCGFGALVVTAMSLGTFWTAHALLAGLVLAEITKSGSQLVYYRRGV